MIFSILTLQALLPVWLSCKKKIQYSKKPHEETENKPTPIKVIQFFDLAFTDVCNQIRIFANITLTVNFLSCN